jgi:hypothetical protein
MIRCQEPLEAATHIVITYPKKDYMKNLQTNPIEIFKPFRAIFKIIEWRLHIYSSWALVIFTMIRLGSESVFRDFVYELVHQILCILIFEIVGVVDVFGDDLLVDFIGIIDFFSKRNHTTHKLIKHNS